MSLTSTIVDKYADGSAATTNANGFVTVDGQIIATVLNKMAITAILAKTWIVPGVSCSEELTEGVDANKVWSVYVQVQSDIGPTTRTFGQGGTTGNNGIINFAPAVVTTDQVIEVKLNQIDDQPLFFPRIQLETMTYDKVKSTLENYLNNIVVSKATYETAVAIAYSHFRASAEYHANSKTLPSAQFIKFDSTKIYDENYMVKILNEMDEAMSAGDIKMNAMTFSGVRAVAARLPFINAFKTPKTGFVTNASNEAYKLLTSPSFDINNPDVFGDVTEQKRMEVRGYTFYEIPKNAFVWIAGWLGVTASALDKIHAVITSPLQLATGGVLEANVMTKEQASPYPGTYMAPYRKFGAAGYRNIILVVEQDYVPDTSLIGASEAITAPKPCVAPANWGVKTSETVQNTLSNGPSLKFAK